MILTLVVLSLALPIFLCVALQKMNLEPNLPTGNRFGSIDGLRGYLALLVAVHHFSIWQDYLLDRQWDVPEETFFANAGSGGVAIFFMISGALFYTILDRKSGVVPWVPLYISRFFRIVPLLIIAVSFLYIIGILRGGTPSGQDAAAAIQWILALGMPNMLEGKVAKQDIAGVLWTLKWEWFFYFTLPLIALAQRVVRSYLLRILILSSIGAILMIIRGLEIGPNPPMYFLLGILAVEIAKKIQHREVMHSMQMTILSMACTAAAFFIAPSIYSPLAGILLFIPFVAVLSSNDHFGFLSTKFSRALGELSYGIYLLHGIVLSLIFTDFGAPLLDADDRWLLMPVTIFAIVLISRLTYAIIEKPGILLGKNLSAKYLREIAKWSRIRTAKSNSSTDKDLSSG